MIERGNMWLKVQRVLLGYHQEKSHQELPANSYFMGIVNTYNEKTHISNNTTHKHLYGCVQK